jgi:hypothetical protein
MFVLPIGALLALVATVVGVSLTTPTEACDIRNAIFVPTLWFCVLLAMGVGAEATLQLEALNVNVVVSECLTVIIVLLGGRKQC